MPAIIADGWKVHNANHSAVHGLWVRTFTLFNVYSAKTFISKKESFQCCWIQAQKIVKLLLPFSSNMSRYAIACSIFSPTVALIIILILGPLSPRSSFIFHLANCWVISFVSELLCFCLCSNTLFNSDQFRQWNNWMTRSYCSTDCKNFDV